MSAVLRVKSVVRGYHIYKDEWNPGIGDIFKLDIEEANRHDRYAVSDIVGEKIISHVPQEISKIIYYFISNQGIATGEVEGKRKQSSLHMKGVVIPCIYVFSSEHKKIKKLRRLLDKHVGEILTLL